MGDSNKKGKTMDLETVRKELDKLDKSLQYHVLLRLSLSAIIGRIKAGQGLAIYQPEREKEIYDSLKLFSEHTGVSLDLLVDMYKELMSETVRIQENLEKYDYRFTKADTKYIKSSLDIARHKIDEFLQEMHRIENTLNAGKVKRNNFLGVLSQLYEDLL